MRRAQERRESRVEQTEGRQTSPSKFQQTEIVKEITKEAEIRNNLFCFAVWTGNLDRVRQLLAEGADVNKWTGKSTNLELLELLLSQPGFIVDPGYLEWACFLNVEDIVRRLCQVDGIDLNYSGGFGTAMSSSVFFPRLGCVKLLISHGAKVSQENIQFYIQNLRGFRSPGDLEVLDDALETLKALLEVCQPSGDFRLDVSEDSEEEQEYVVSCAHRKLKETLERAAASRPLSLKQQCRNSIRNVLSLRSNGSSVWPYVERLELESGLPECLVDFLLVFPASGWRQERARKVAESLNNIAVSDLLTVNRVVLSLYF